MSFVETATKPFDPGTTGWTAQDLDDPAIEALWFQGRYEIVEGVLTTMPPAYFAGNEKLQNLVHILQTHTERQGIKGGFAQDVDLVIDDIRVVRADAIFLAPDQKKLQTKAARKAGRKNVLRTRILVPPALIIESLSLGHEVHDRVTKRRWYAEFGVAHYWLFDGEARSLELLELRDGEYHRQAMGRDGDVLKPSLFTGLELKLAEVWGED
jgi:Uma2 family endonuclease